MVAAKDKTQRSKAGRDVKGNFTTSPKDTENWKNWRIWQIACKNGHNKSSHPYMNVPCKVTLSLLPLRSFSHLLTLDLLICFALAKRVTANVIQAKAWEAPVHWSLPFPSARNTSRRLNQPALASTGERPPSTPAILAAQGDTPTESEGLPRPSSLSQAFQSTRTPHSQHAEL